MTTHSVYTKKTKGISFIVVNGKSTLVRGGVPLAVDIDDSKLQSRAKDCTILPRIKKSNSEPVQSVIPAPQKAKSSPKAVSPVDIEHIGMMTIEKKRPKIFKKEDSQTEE